MLVPMLVDVLHFTSAGVFKDNRESFIQKYFRENWLIKRVLYPQMKKFVYGRDDPYITEFEHKIDQNDFKYVEDVCKDLKISYFDTFSYRIFPGRFASLAKLDQMLTKTFGNLGKYPSQIRPSCPSDRTALGRP